MATWKQALSRTRNKITSSLSNFLGSSQGVDEVTFDDLEQTLVEADVPVRLVDRLLDDLRTESGSPHAPRHSLLRQKLLDTFTRRRRLDWSEISSLVTVLIIGVNGSGKTTTTAKLAHLAQEAGLRPLLGAADTFRAAGSDQLKLWADRIGCDVVVGATGADAAAVAYDVIQAGHSRNADVVLVDTAGRMHTKGPLMGELEKIRRSMAKCDPSAPHETWIVLDATVGQNALIQARQFHESVPLTGVIVSKLDGSAKAGFLFGVARELNVPILFAGLGEQPDDLAVFNEEAFVDALLGIEEIVVTAKGASS